MSNETTELKNPIKSKASATVALREHRIVKKTTHVVKNVLARFVRYNDSLLAFTVVCNAAGYCFTWSLSQTLTYFLPGSGLTRIIVDWSLWSILVGVAILLGCCAFPAPPDADGEGDADADADAEVDDAADAANAGFQTSEEKKHDDANSGVSVNRTSQADRIRKIVCPHCGNDAGTDRNLSNRSKRISSISEIGEIREANEVSENRQEVSISTLPTVSIGSATDIVQSKTRNGQAAQANRNEEDKSNKELRIDISRLKLPSAITTTSVVAAAPNVPADTSVSPVPTVTTLKSTSASAKWKPVSPGQNSVQRLPKNSKDSKDSKSLTFDVPMLPLRPPHPSSFGLTNNLANSSAYRFPPITSVPFATRTQPITVTMPAINAAVTIADTITS